MMKTTSTSQARRNILKGEEGLISLDFIFALTMAFSFAAIFFVLAYTLATVEAAQYITYAMARAYHGAHENEQFQKDIAKAKYDELVTAGIFKRIFNQGWIQLSGPVVGDFNDQYEERDPDNAIFVGAQVQFKAKVLNLTFPVVGSTVGDTSTGSATLNAYLMREVTSAECRNFNLQRYEKIRALDSKYGELQPAGVYLITDNGC